MQLTTDRMSINRGRPQGFAFGRSGSIRRHSASVSGQKKDLGEDGDVGVMRSYYHDPAVRASTHHRE